MQFRNFFSILLTATNLPNYDDNPNQKMSLYYYQNAKWSTDALLRPTHPQACQFQKKVSFFDFQILQIRSLDIWLNRSTSNHSSMRRSTANSCTKSCVGTRSKFPVQNLPDLGLRFGSGRHLWIVKLSGFASQDPPVTPKEKILLLFIFRSNRNVE